MSVELYSGNSQEQQRDNSEFIKRLERWAKERSVKAERQVRVRIAKAARTDLESPSDPKNIQRIQAYKSDVDRMFQYTIDKLGELRMEELQKLGKDGRITRIRRNDANNSWVSEEVYPAGVISQSEIFDDPLGKSKVTLHYSGQSYAKLNAELNETRIDIPTAAKVIFLNHAASMDVIRWRSPLSPVVNRVIHPAQAFMTGALRKLSERVR